MIGSGHNSRSVSALHSGGEIRREHTEKASDAYQLFKAAFLATESESKTEAQSRLRSSENQTDGVVSRVPIPQSPQVETRLPKVQAERRKLEGVGLLCDWLVLPLPLPTTTIWFTLEYTEQRSHKRNREKMETFQVSDSDSVEFMLRLRLQFLLRRKVNLTSKRAN